MNPVAGANLSLVPAGPADWPAVLALLRECGLPPDGLAEHFGAALVALDGPRLAGCAALELYPPDTLLRSVAVAPDYRGMGLGRRLVGGALGLAGSRGVSAVYLLTETAGDYFKRFGFAPIGREAVPPAVQGSVEFTTACPAGALAMRLRLD
jgi:amino-acid N-acetyltransferase